MGYTLASKYAGLQAMAAILIYAIPTMTCVQLGMDRYTSLWIGSFPLAALLVPALIAVVYLLQRGKSPRHDLAMTLGIAPGILFFLLGVFTMYHSTRYSDRLRTSDACQTLAGAADLVKYADEAKEFHRKCAEQLPEGETTLLPSCPGYDDMLSTDQDREAAWQFLQQMERDFYCGGFCNVRTRPLWTPSFTTVEPCSLPIAMRLSSYTHTCAIEVAAYAAAVMLVFVFWVSFMWDSVKGMPLPGVAAPDLYYPAEGGPGRQ